MGDLLDEILKRHVTPVTRASGLTRHGLVYRHAAPNGDVVFLDFSRYPLVPGVRSFHAILSIAPVPWVEWVTRKRPGPAKGRQHALEQVTVRAPEPWRIGRHLPSDDDALWAATEVDGIGAALADELRTRLPWMLGFLDREVLLTEARNPDSELFPGEHQRVLAQAVLDLDQHAIDALGEHNPLVPWLRQRLRSR